MRNCYCKLITGELPGVEYCKDSCEDCKYFMTKEEAKKYIKEK